MQPCGLWSCIWRKETAVIPSFTSNAVSRAQTECWLRVGHLKYTIRSAAGTNGIWIYYSLESIPSFIWDSDTQLNLLARRRDRGFRFISRRNESFCQNLRACNPPENYSRVSRSWKVLSTFYLFFLQYLFPFQSSSWWNWALLDPKTSHKDASRLLLC